MKTNAKYNELMEEANSLSIGLQLAISRLRDAGLSVADIAYRERRGTCRRCKWWERDDPPFERDGHCINPLVIGRRDSFDVPPISGVVSEPEVTNGGSALMTGPDFGCVHQEAKE